MTKKNKLNRRWLTESEKFNFKNPTIEFFTEMFKDGIEKLVESDTIDKYMKKLIKRIEKDYDEWGGGTDLTLDEVAEHFGVSRAAILKLESKVLTVFERYMESQKTK